jgi:hypothetical protein
MFDGGKIILGIVAFLVLVLFPIWYTAANGNAGYRPEIEPPPGGESACVEDTDFMRSNHMDLLDRWRDDYVRHGDRIHHSDHTGKEYTKSLSGTCMSCHSNKAAFCDRCHDYMGVSPYCWNCHVEPQGE